MISLIRKFIPSKIRIASFIVVISGFVTTIDMVLKAYFPALSKSLGIFIPLIVVNCIILARAEAFASKNSVFDSFLDGVTMGIGFTFALILLATIREVLGNGSWYNISLFGQSFQPVTFMIMPAGGFLALGTLIAIIQKIRSKGDNA
ncbi:Electron transport complex subunit RnfE [bioreactor metagenome]|uniref:Electron transport complex subunit RnfE n=1 Tax=bioreactor metagenome TaxID=1076179 RepID=A0A645H1Y4_9ZZZZ